MAKKLKLIPVELIAALPEAVAYDQGAVQEMVYAYYDATKFLADNGPAIDEDKKMTPDLIVDGLPNWPLPTSGNMDGPQIGLDFLNGAPGATSGPHLPYYARTFRAYNTAVNAENNDDAVAIASEAPRLFVELWNTANHLNRFLAKDAGKVAVGPLRLERPTAKKEDI